MPIGRSAKKSLRKSIKNKKVNSSFKNKVKDIIKKFLVKPEKKAFGEVQAILDKAEKKHLYQRNKVARLKAKYAKKVGKDVEKVVIKKKSAKKVVKRKVAKK
ncbi:MAG: 30S ribosomal protein S20 [Candidatus Shapirobacteria bacterium]|jgi:ribosomal protein S20